MILHHSMISGGTPVLRSTHPLHIGSTGIDTVLLRTSVTPLHSESEARA